MLDTRAMNALQPEPAAGYTFGRFVLRRRERLLLLDGAPVELGSRAVEVLLALVEADGALLTKGALMDRVWPDTAVEENNLQVQISALRRALGPDRDWIATVPGRGYRFTGPVEVQSDEEVATAAPKATLHLPSGQAAPPMSVLILPFAARGADPTQGWFADSVTDSLTTDLARALPPGSAVIAQTSADAYRGHAADVRAIGREQGVRYVVEGSVLLTDDWVRINAQLIATDTGAHLWAERFDTPRQDVLQVQDEIVGRLARTAGLQMIGAEARRAEQADHERPGEGTAQDYALRAHAAASQGKMTRNSAEAACALYTRALERDSGDADALAGLACVQVSRVMNGYLDAGWRTVCNEAQTREAQLAEAEKTLARALAAAPGHFKALKGRAVLLRARGRFADAIAVTEALRAQNPGDPGTLRETGLNLLYLGRANEAVAWLQRADALAPGDPIRWTWLLGLGRALIHLGRDAEAVTVLRLAVVSNPAFALSHALLAAALALTSEDAAARAAIAEFRRAEPDMPVEVLARRSAVPFEATDPLYRSRNARVLEGLRRAASLLAPQPGAPELVAA